MESAFTDKINKINVEHNTKMENMKETYFQ